MIRRLMFPQHDNVDGVWSTIAQSVAGGPLKEAGVVLAKVAPTPSSPGEHVCPCSYRQTLSPHLMGLIYSPSSSFGSSVVVVYPSKLLDTDARVDHTCDMYVHGRRLRSKGSEKGELHIINRHCTPPPDPGSKPPMLRSRTERELTTAKGHNDPTIKIRDRTFSRQVRPIHPGRYRFQPSHEIEIINLETTRGRRRWK